MGTAARTTVVAMTVGAFAGLLAPAASADQQVPAGTLGVISAMSPASGVAATPPTVTSSAPCDGKDADGTTNPDQNTIAVILFSPSLDAAGKQKTGQTVQASTANYSRTSPMSVPFGQTFTDAFKMAGATIAPNERVRIEMKCIDALATPGGTFEGSVLFNADASRYTFDAPAAALATTTTLAVSPASPAPYNTQETLTATVSPAAAGTVTFANNGTAIGSPVTVTNGTATTTTTLPIGTASLTAAFTPSVPTAFVASSSTAQSYVVKPAPPVVTVTAPATLAEGGATAPLTGMLTNPAAADGGVDYPKARLDFTLTASSPLDPTKVHLVYQTGGTPPTAQVPFVQGANANTVTGYFGPQAGFDVAPGYSATTPFTTSLDQGATQARSISIASVLDDVTTPTTPVALSAVDTDVVTVVGAPNAPALTSVTPGNGTLTANFIPNAADAGTANAATSFTATATPAGGGTPVSVTDATSPLTVTGLTNGTAYTVTVTGTNTQGTGPASNAITATPSTAPDAPTAVTVTPGNGKLTVAFTPPVNPGNPVTSYTVTATPTTGAAVTATGSSSPIVVPGLTNGTVYAVTVTATNAVGTSAASTPAVNGTPAATAPGAPTGVMVSPGDAKLLVTFTAPADNGGSAITGYTVTATPASGTPVTATGTTSPITVTGLTNGTAYTVTVKATNAVGTGAASPGVLGTPKSAAVVVPTLKIQTSKVFVNKGERITLTGVLARNAVGISGQDVVLKVTYSDGVTNTVGATKTDASGNYVFTTMPLYNGFFFTQALGVTSDQAFSRVILTYRSARAAVRGNKVTVTAETRPGFLTSSSRQERVQLLLVDSRGRQLKVLQLVNAKQRKFFPGEAQGTNQIAFKTQTLAKGTYRLVVKVIGTPVNTGASSKTITVTIT